MKSGYRVFVHARSLALLPKSGRRRDQVLSFLDTLEAGFHSGGGTGSMDPASSRIYRVATVAGFVVTWWVDDAVLEIKVVRIENIPR